MSNQRLPPVRRILLRLARRAHVGLQGQDAGHRRRRLARGEAAHAEEDLRRGHRQGGEETRPQGGDVPRRQTRRPSHAVRTATGICKSSF